MRHIARILRKMGMSYQKPYVTDLKRPKDAEAIFKKKRLARAGLLKDVVLGFLDESPHYLANRENRAIAVIWYAETAEEYCEEGAGELIWILCPEWSERLFCEGFIAEKGRR